MAEPKGIIRTERLDALCDAVFAFAMTLLVINLQLPDGFDPQTGKDLLNALLDLADALVVYVISFVVLAAFWIGKARLHAAPRLASAELVWWVLFQLFFVTLIPFSTMVVGRYDFLPGVWLYAINMILTALISLRVSRVASRESGETTPTESALDLWVLIASALLSMLISALGAGSEAMWAYALNAASPLLRRLKSRSGQA